jgi:hypothetical protein
LLGFSEISKVRQAYNRNRFVLQTMIDQVYDRIPPHVETALEDAERLGLVSLQAKRQSPNAGPRDFETRCRKGSVFHIDLQ